MPRRKPAQDALADAAAEPRVQAPDGSADRVLGDEGQTWQTADGTEPPYPPHETSVLDEAMAIAEAADEEGDPLPVLVTDYDANGEAVDLPVEMRPQLPMEVAAKQIGLWPEFDGYQPNSVEAAIGGRIELGYTDADKVLARAIGEDRLNKQVIITVLCSVDGKLFKVNRKKGSFDGVQGTAFLHVVKLISASEA